MIDNYSLNRREMLATTGAAAVATSTAPLCAMPDDRGYIDSHVHVWNADVTKYPLAEGYKREDMKPATFTPQELFAHCRPCGVGRVVLIQMSFYGTDNSLMLDAMKAHPGVFSGVAVVDERSATVTDKMRRLKKLGVRGFRIRPGKQKPDEWLADDAMQRFWRLGAEEKLAMCHLIDANYLPSVDRMCDKHSDTPVVIDHFARIGVDGQIRDDDVKNLCRLARHKNVWVKVSAFYALGKKKPPYTDLGPLIRRVRDAFGAKRLMWASDCPFQVDPGHNYRDSIDLVRERLDFLSADEKESLLKKTAERVFFGS
jgi:predicted TIM-barrel fold metal-dependent hydrolase